MTDEIAPFGSWLRSIRAQERDTGVDHRELACYAGKLTDRVSDQLSHAMRLAEELYFELPSVAHGEERQRAYWEENRTAYVTRMRTILDHMGHTLAAVGCTDAELAASHGAEDTQIKHEAGESVADTTDDGPDAEKTVTVSLPDTWQARVSLLKK